LKIDLPRSFMIGDRWRDVDCGHGAGCVTILMNHDYRESLNQTPDYVVGSFLQAVNVILSSANPDMTSLSDLRVKIFADGADKKGILEFYRDTLIKGLTTNPTLMRKAGISDYAAFAKDILETVTAKPISFEVFSDEFSEMRRQALLISRWQSNVYVKIPITNTRGESAVPLIGELAKEGVKMNVTALLTVDQVRAVAGVLQPGLPSVVSLFGGRIADTARDPVPAMKSSLEILRGLPQAELLWGSCREVLNIRQADDCGVPIITVTHDILKKAINLWGRDLADVSLDTVKMFHEDAKAAGYKL
jgi:transaldolase